MALRFTFTGAFTITYDAVWALLAGAGSAACTIGLKLTHGRRQGSQTASTRPTPPSDSGEDTYLLAAGLADLYGERLEISAIKSSCWRPTRRTRIP